MRINVYAEELTTDIRCVFVKPDNHKGNEFFGLRVFLISPEDLHNDKDDDDRSAITFWFPNNGSGILDSIRFVDLLNLSIPRT